MNAKVIKSKQPLRVFRVYLRDGREFPVDAATWARQYQPDDEIKFYDEKGKKVENVFVRAPDTSAVAPESSLSVSPPIAALQNDVKALESRVDTLERNQSGLREMIERAVESSIESAFAKRGM